MQLTKDGTERERTAIGAVTDGAGALPQATLERDVAASGLDVKFLSPPAIGEEQLIELD